MKKLILGCIAATLLLSACNKGGDGGSSANRTTQISTGKWQQIAQTSQTIAAGVAGPVDDDFATMSACEKDDYTYFKSDKTIVIDEGATKCNTTDPQIYTVGTWALLSNDTKLRQTNPVITLDWDIDQLDDNTLKITNTETDNIGGVSIVYKNTSTFKHVN